MNFDSPKEVSDILKLNYRTILDLIVMGELPAIRIGKQYRISEDDLFRFINNNICN